MEHTLTGEFRYHENFASQFLGNQRTLIVYLPPGYDYEAERRYPVLYLHDGQNVFDRATAFMGQEWQVDETAQTLIEQGKIEPLIIVGIYNTGEQRINEYTQTHDERKHAGGQAGLYGRMLVEEIKPFIDRRYRTRHEPQHTGLGGSSLGGLVTLHLGLRYQQYFGKLLVMSPSVWWDRGVILREVEWLRAKPPTRIWLDMGSREGHILLEQARMLRDRLLAQGWQLKADLHYHEARGARHTESAWAKRVGPALKFLFPAK
ncbi:MAG: alpha/beta hydrolase [Acidobacteria bacterium]|nr:alpha/beta hydrolase [Acidobacteriota bacterium]MBI3422747.1 alpha/beta hydrolase [Acidobacteriota bacterium]